MTTLEQPKVKIIESRHPNYFKIRTMLHKMPEPLANDGLNKIAKFINKRVKKDGEYNLFNLRLDMVIEDDNDIKWEKITPGNLFFAIRGKGLIVSYDECVVRQPKYDDDD